MVRQYRYIDFRDREQIAARYLNGDRVADIAAGLGVTTATVYRELKRGETGELDRNQRRTVMLNYEVLANIYKSRRNHKLDEWHTFCDWIEGLPYSELITGPSLKDIPISDEIMEEAKRRVHEELNAQLNHFCKIHEGFSIKIPKEKVAPEVLNLIDRVEREEQQRVKFGNHIPLAYYCQRCDAKKNGEATDAYCQKCPYKVQNDKVKIVEISVMSDGSLEPRFVMETEDDRNGQQ